MDSFSTKLLDWVRRNNVQRFKNEKQLRDEIQRRFGGKTEAEYPAACYTGPNGGAGKCDIVIPFNGGSSRWIEVKYVQTYMYQSDPRYNLSFEKWAFSDSEISVKHDLVHKLTPLIRDPSVNCVGMLAVFLFSDRYPLPAGTMDRLASLVPRPPWAMSVREAWANPDHRTARSWILPIYWEQHKAQK